MTSQESDAEYWGKFYLPVHKETGEIDWSSVDQNPPRTFGELTDPVRRLVEGWEWRKFKIVPDEG